MFKIAIALYYTIACTTPLPPYHMYNKFSTAIFPLPSAPSISGGFQQAMFYLCSEFRGLSSVCSSGDCCTVAPPRGRLGWTCPPHFCQKFFLRLMQIRGAFFFLGGEASVTFGVWPTSLRNTENEANLLLRLGIQKMKGFQLKKYPKIFLQFDTNSFWRYTFGHA